LLLGAPIYASELDQMIFKTLRNLKWIALGFPIFGFLDLDILTYLHKIYTLITASFFYTLWTHISDTLDSICSSTTTPSTHISERKSQVVKLGRPLPMLGRQKDHFSFVGGRCRSIKASWVSLSDGYILEDILEIAR